MSRPLPARALGIDFGTSNSSVGWQGPQTSRLLPLEGDKCSLPSVIFFNNEERRPAYGRQALDEYLDGYEGRLLRSLNNMLETYPAFVALALALAVTGKTGGLGATGALVWIAARMVFTLFYVAGVPVLRTLAWFVSIFGLVLMVVRLMT